MKDKGTLILIGILVLVGGVLGYAIFQSGALKRQADTSGRPVGTTTTTTTTTATREESDLEEWVLKNFPGPNASEEELGLFGDAIEKIAVQASVLDISDCFNPSPVVFRLTQNTAFTARNSSSVDHTIGVSEFSVVVPAGSEVSVLFDDRIGGGGYGNYGYACDDQAPVGIFVIVPPS